VERRRSTNIMMNSTLAGLRCTGATAFVNRPSPVVSRLPAGHSHALSSGNAKSQSRRVSSCSHPALSAPESTCTPEHLLGGTRKYGMQALLSTSRPGPSTPHVCCICCFFARISLLPYLQDARLVVTNARNVNQERGTKQSLKSEKQSSKAFEFKQHTWHYGPEISTACMVCCSCRLCTLKSAQFINGAMRGSCQAHDCLCCLSHKALCQLAADNYPLLYLQPDPCSAITYLASLWPC